MLVRSVGIVIGALCIVECVLLLVHKLFVRLHLRLGSNLLGFCCFLITCGSFDLGVVLATSESGLRCSIFRFFYCCLGFRLVCICLFLLCFGSLRIVFSCGLLVLKLGSLGFCCSFLLLGLCLVRRGLRLHVLRLTFSSGSVALGFRCFRCIFFRFRRRILGNVSSPFLVLDESHRV